MSKLLFDGPHLFFSTEVAAIIGRNEAIVLQQIYYWMSVSGGKVVDEIKWFWKTYQQWSQELQLSVSTVRRVIGNLKNLGLIQISRLSAKTYYQANWYTLNQEAIEALVQNEHIDEINLNSSMCSELADDIKDSSSLEFSPQQHTVVEEKQEVVEQSAPKSQSPKQNQEQPSHCADKSQSQTQNHEQAEITHFVDDIEEVCLVSDEESDEGQCSEAEVEVVMTLDSPTKLEIREVCTELKRLRINPHPCLGVIRKYWDNVAGAIARVKEAMNEGWCNNPTGLFINSCKSGEKPKNTVDTAVSDWFEWARRERIVIAMSGGMVYTVDGEAVEIQEMMRRYPMAIASRLKEAFIKKAKEHNTNATELLIEYMKQYLATPQKNESQKIEELEKRLVKVEQVLGELAA